MGKRIYNFIIGGVYFVRKLLMHPIQKLRYKEWNLSSTIINPLKITPRYISVGHGVYVFSNARIEGISRYNNNSYTPHIRLCDGVSIQQGLHLTCANHIEIGKNTAVAANVTITDIHHPYKNIDIPIERQDIEVSEVVIGEDCKIYNGAVILPGVHIGRHVTVGANAVVNINIPDFCVAVGSPARIIKRYNEKTQRWEKTDKNGFFLEK